MESPRTRPKSVNVVKPASWQLCPVLSPGEAQRLVLGPRERKIRSREIPDLACSGEPEFLTERGHQLPHSKVSQSSDFWAYLGIGLDLLNGVGGLDLVS